MDSLRGSSISELGTTRGKISMAPVQGRHAQIENGEQLRTDCAFLPGPSRQLAALLHRLPDGVGTSGSLTGGPPSLRALPLSHTVRVHQAGEQLKCGRRRFWPRKGGEKEVEEEGQRVQRVPLGPWQKKGAKRGRSRDRALLAHSFAVGSLAEKTRNCLRRIWP